MIITSSPAEIGRRIKEIRRSKEMSQEELGRKIGVTRATINKYEYGQVNFPRDRIELLSKALNVTPSYLLGWDDDMLAEYVPVKKSRLFDPANMPQAGASESPSYDMKALVKKLKEAGQLTPLTPDERKALGLPDLAPGERAPLVQTDPNLDELIRIYKALSIKDRNKLLSYAYELEDKISASSNIC